MTRNIFDKVIRNHPVFKDQNNAVDQVVREVQTHLNRPEDLVCKQGETAHYLYLLSKGDCNVLVRDELRENRLVKSLKPGSIFGEVGLITKNTRTATVICKNYCTIASLDKVIFDDMCERYPEIFLKLKEKMSEYQDRWKIFLRKLLEGVYLF